MWHSYTYNREPCEDGCCRRAGAHENNYWACPACVRCDKAAQLEKLLRYFEVENYRKKITSYGPHTLKYRKEYVQMGGAISSFDGVASCVCDRNCCWKFEPTSRSSP